MSKVKHVCFIIQQFGDYKVGDGFFDQLYDDVIEIAVKEAGAQCIRADQILGAEPKTEQIESQIKRAAICIAEVTENNPNVFFEIGYAIALKRPTFVLWDKAKRNQGLPFDIHGKAGIPYDSSNNRWRKELRERLVANIILELSTLDEPTLPSSITVSELFNKYLPYCKNYNAPRTYEYYSGHINSFLKFMEREGEAGKPAVNLDPAWITRWIDTQEGWSDSYIRGGITAIQVPFNWALGRGYITENPIKSVKKPNPVKRNNPMPLEHYEKLLSLIDESDSFRDVLILMWHSDIRPEELRNLEADYLDPEMKCIRMPQGSARTGQQRRIIYLHKNAVEVLEKLKAEHPKGKLFLNSRGVPWTKFALCNRLYRYSKIIGKSYTLSDCRNGILNNSLNVAA